MRTMDEIFMERSALESAVDTLRTRLAAVERERDEARGEWDVWREGCALADTERDAAVQRAADIERATVARIVAFVNTQITAYAVAGDVLRASLIASIACSLESGAWRGKEAP